MADTTFKIATRYIPRPGYFQGIHREGGRITWKCQHRHEIKDHAQHCAEGGPKFRATQ